MRAWVGGLGLDQAGFAARFFDRHPGSPVVAHLRRASEVVAAAETWAEMRAATDALAAGMLAVGLDGWPRFLREAHERAIPRVGGLQRRYRGLTDGGVRDQADGPAPLRPHTARGRLGRGIAAALASGSVG